MAARKSTSPKSKTVTTKLVTRTINEIEFQLRTDLGYADDISDYVDAADSYSTAKAQFYGDADHIVIVASCGDIAAVIKTEELVALGEAVKATQKG